LRPSPHEIPDTKLALSALQVRLEVQNRREESRTTVPSPVLSKIRFFQARKLQHPGRWWIAVAAAALVALLVLPNAGALANQFLLINSANGVFSFNAAKARAYLAQTGQSSDSIPSQLDRATYTITLAAGVIINYGNKCQQQDQDNQGCSGGKPFYIGEIPSP